MTAPGQNQNTGIHPTPSAPRAPIPVNWSTLPADKPGFSRHWDYANGGWKVTPIPGYAQQQATSDPFGGLSGADRDAAVAVQNLFAGYGIGTLAPKIVDYIKQGYSADTISILLQQTPEYKARFAGNDARVKAGLGALSPAQYIATEQAYRNVLQEAGVPSGFYDSPSDFTDWIAKDVSPTEIKSRVDAASQVITQADPGVLNAFRQYYSTGDMIAYALDPNRAAPLVGKAFQAAQVGGAALDQGINVGQGTAEQLAGNGVSFAQAQQGFGQVAQDSANYAKLGQISGVATSQNDLVQSVFNSNGQDVLKVNRLASQERARFAASSGQGQSSMTRDSAGQL